MCALRVQQTTHTLHELYIILQLSKKYKETYYEKFHY